MFISKFLRRFRIGASAAAAFLSLCLLTGAPARAGTPVHTADQPGVPSRERPGQDRPDLPPFADEAPADLKTPRLPAPPVPEAPASADGPRVFVSGIEWRGNTVFSDEALNRLVEDDLDREISFEELQGIRLKITRHYIDHGYINSGAVIPDQEIVSGTVLVNIVEGRLASVSVSGNERIRTPYLESRLADAAGPPLNINDLQAQVQILHQNPLIDRVTAELKPGLRLGEAILAADITEASPFTAGLEVGNRWSPRVGSFGGEVYAAHRNLTGWGDSLGLRFDKTRGLDDLLAYYSLPLTRRDTTLKIRYEYSDADVVEDPFEDLDITGKADTFAVEFTHPFYRTPSAELIFGLRGEIRHSETTLLGEPFSFSPGVQDGESDISVIRFSQEWLSRSRWQVIAVRSVFSLGVDAFGATINDGDLPDGEFFSWLGQFQWAGRLAALGGSQLIFRTDMQFCNRSVLPLEKFSVGGAYSVRGYPEDLFVRDNGVVGSLELRYPAVRVPVPGISRTAEDGIVQLAAFTDWGWSENVDTPTLGPASIGSAGVGVRWDPSSRLHAQLYWGIPFRDIDYASDDLQNDGIHFQLNWRVF